MSLRRPMLRKSRPTPLKLSPPESSTCQLLLISTYAYNTIPPSQNTGLILDESSIIALPPRPLDPSRDRILKATAVKSALKSLSLSAPAFFDSEGPNGFATDTDPTRESLSSPTKLGNVNNQCLIGFTILFASCYQHLACPDVHHLLVRLSDSWIRLMAKDHWMWCTPCTSRTLHKITIVLVYSLTAHSDFQAELQGSRNQTKDTMT